MKDAIIFNIPIDELPSLNADFKRYIHILHENGIHDTSDLVTAYLSCTISGIRGPDRKFHLTLRDFVNHQRKYQENYKNLRAAANAARNDATHRPLVQLFLFPNFNFIRKEAI